jgi:F-type H+-transporting ATPase subunit b
MGVFLTVLVILNRLLFQPILETFDERARRVEDAKTQARALEAETAKQVAAYQGQLKEARSEGERLREAMRKTASAESERLVRRTREETGDRLGELRERIAREYMEAFSTLKVEAREMARAVAVRVLGRTVQ